MLGAGCNDSGAGAPRVNGDAGAEGDSAFPIDSAFSEKDTTGEQGEPDGAGRSLDVGFFDTRWDLDGGTGTVGETALDGGPGEARFDADISGASMDGNGLSVPSCDDGNRCTADSWDFSSGCIHTPIDDSQPCDDGDACTEKDRCVAGTCRGNPRASVPAVLGRAQSYGGEPALQTVVGFPSPDRAVFLSGDQLTLVKIEGEGMEVLDRLQWGSHVRSSQISPTIWVTRPRTFIVPVSSQRIAVVGADWSIDLFDIGENRFRQSLRYSFGSGGQDMIAAIVPQDNYLWTCIGNWVRRYEIDDARGFIKQGSGFGLPAGHSCYGLAIADDTLLAATADGLDVIDISKKDGTGALLKTVLPDTRLLDVAQGGSTIAVYQLESFTSGVGKILVLDASDYSVLASFASADPITPIGFSLSTSGLLVESWDQQECRSVRADLYSLATSITTPSVSFVPMSACRAHFGLPPAVITASGPLVDLPPAHQIVRVDAQKGTVTAIHGREQGSFARVRAVGASLVEVHGPTSMHMVDISQPSAPVVTDGGMIWPMTADWLRVEISPDGRPFILTVPDSDLALTGPKTSLYWQSASGLPRIEGSIGNDDPDAQWAAAGRYLYSVSPKGVEDFRLRRFPVSRLTREENQTPSPDVDVVVTGVATLGLDQRQGILAVADVRTGDLVVTERRMGVVNTVTTTGTVLNWFTPIEGSYGLVSTRTPDSGILVDLGVASGRCVLIFTSAVFLVDKTGQTLAASAGKDRGYQRLLSFDDDYLYVAASFSDASRKSVDGVLVLRSSDLSDAGQYVLPEPVLSSTVAGDYRVFGMTSTLAVVSPVCKGSNN